MQSHQLPASLSDHLNDLSSKDEDIGPRSRYHRKPRRDNARSFANDTRDVRTMFHKRRQALNKKLRSDRTPKVRPKRTHHHSVQANPQKKPILATSSKKRTSDNKRMPVRNFEKVKYLT